MAEKKLIKGPDGKYYTPTAYKNQWGKQNVDISNMKITDVKVINSNPVPGKTRIGNLAKPGGAGLGGMFGVKNR